jgi:hypothetical protein
MYLMYVGRGYVTLGRIENGIAYLERAIEFCGEHSLNQLMFEAEAALTDARRSRRSLPAEPFEVAPEAELNDVVLAIESMKEMAGIA